MKVNWQAAFACAALSLGMTGIAQAQSLISLNKPVTGSSFYDSGTETFTYQNIDDGRFDDTGSPSNWSFWLTPNGQTGFATIDLQGSFLVSSFQVQNTHNRGFNDRGTQNFTISVSNDGTNFTNLVTDTFADPRNSTLPIVTYNSFAPTTASFVRFNINSFYGSSGGINELSVFGTAISASAPEPGTAALLLFAAPTLLGGLALRRRR